MKRILLLALLVMLVSPVMGLGSPVKETFQDYVSMTGAGWVHQGGWYFNYPNYPMANIIQESTTGRTATYFRNSNVVGYQYTGMYNEPTTFTYAAWSGYDHSTHSTPYSFILYDAGWNQLWKPGGAFYGLPDVSYGRCEVVISGGTARLYRDDVLVETSGVLATNPSYIMFYGSSDGGSGWTRTIDDVVLGYESDPVIIGVIPSDWFIMFDAASPASTGLYKVNASDMTKPIPKNSNYYGVSYGRNVPDATTLQIIDPRGNVQASYPVANMSAACTLPIADLYSSGAIANGRWRASLADDAETSYFYVMGSGATVDWSSDTYTVGDTARIDYSVLSTSWDTGTYTYRMDILDVYGNVVYTTPLSTQSGYIEPTLSEETYPAGVYYAAVIQTTSGTDTWLGYDATEVSAYIAFNGDINDAETQMPITGTNVTVKITQGSISDTVYSGTGGNYTSTAGLAFGTGANVNYTVSASGYRTAYSDFTPMLTKTITKNVTLIPTAVSCTGICLGGISSDSIYKRPVGTATIAVTNATYGESYSATSNGVGYYILDETDGVVFTNGRCYTVTSSKAGYTGNSYFKCVVGT